MVKQQKVGKNYDILKLSISDDMGIPEALPILLQTIEDCFQKEDYKIILDMQRIKFPTPSFIAFLIEITARARRSGGDFKLINLSPSATNNLVTFSPLSYLAIDGEEAYAVEELSALVRTRREPKPAPVEKPVAEESRPKTTPPGGETDNRFLPNEEKAKNESAKKPESPAKPGTEVTSKPESDPAFHIKEVKIELPDLPVPPKSNHLKTVNRPKSDLFSAAAVENDEEPPQTKEIKIHPPTDSGARIDDSGEIILHSKTAPNALANSNPESAQQNADANKKTEIPQVKRIRVKSKIESLYDICDFVTGLADKVGFCEKEVAKIKVTVYEACINVIEHAYHSDPDEWIVVTVQYDSQDFTIIIQDWGESFNFDDSKPYDVNKAVHDRKTGGFGMFIILRSMDEVKYKTDPVNGNRLVLRKKIPKKN